MPSSPLFARWLSRTDSAKPAFRDPQGTRRWRDAIGKADRVASGLLNGRRSLEGERVALLVSPGAAFVECLFGVWRAGGCAVVLSPLHPTPETAYFCGDAGVRTVIASKVLFNRVAFLAPAIRITTPHELLAYAGGRIASEP